MILCHTGDIRVWNEDDGNKADSQSLIEELFRHFILKW